MKEMLPEILSDTSYKEIEIDRYTAVIWKKKQQENQLKQLKGIYYGKMTMPKL